MNTVINSYAIDSVMLSYGRISAALGARGTKSALATPAASVWIRGVKTHPFRHG